MRGQLVADADELVGLEQAKLDDRLGAAAAGRSTLPALALLAAG
jgi:hypothetical protein